MSAPEIGRTRTSGGRRSRFVMAYLDELGAIEAGFPAAELATARSVFLALLVDANDNEHDRSRTASTRRDLAALAGVHISTVAKVATRLVELGLLRREEAAGKPTVYVLVDLSSETTPPEPVASNDTTRRVTRQDPSPETTGPSHVYGGEEEDAKKEPAETPFAAGGDGEQLGLLAEPQPEVKREVIKGKFRGEPWEADLADVEVVWAEWERVVLEPYGRRSNKGLADAGVKQIIAKAVAVSSVDICCRNIRSKVLWTSENRVDRLRKGTTSPVYPSEVFETTPKDSLSLGEKLERGAEGAPPAGWLPRTDITVAAAGGQVTATTSLTPKELERVDFLKDGIRGGMRRAQETPEHRKWEIEQRIKPVVQQYVAELRDQFSIGANITKNEDGSYTVEFADMVTA